MVKFYFSRNGPNTENTNVTNLNKQINLSDENTNKSPFCRPNVLLKVESEKLQQMSLMEWPENKKLTKRKGTKSILTDDAKKG